MRYVLSVALAGALALTPSVAAGASPATTVGTGDAGQTAIEFVAKVDQTGPRFDFYGYATYVRGLPESALFAKQGIDQSEATARITFSGSTTLTQRSIMGDDVYALTSSGAITFHLAPGGASFSDPSSFSRGPAIATELLRFQNLITVRYSEQAGDSSSAGTTAISIGSGDLAQRASAVFAIGGKRYRLGRKGLDQRVFADGQGTLVDQTTPRAVMLVAGDASGA